MSTKWVIGVVGLGVVLLVFVFVPWMRDAGGVEAEPVESAQGYKSDRPSVGDAVSGVIPQRASVREEVQVAPRFAPVNVAQTVAELGTVMEQRGRVILTPAEVLRLAGEPTGREGEDLRVRESLERELWDGHSHLLVQALERGRGIALEHEQVMAFLQGEKGGWSDNSYRWIADELMTILREEMPETTLADLSGLVENTGLDAAIRGYALQHVGHLADQFAGTLEEEGAVGFSRRENQSTEAEVSTERTETEASAPLTLLWQAARGNDADLKSTALLGLYQFARRHPEVQPVEEVTEYTQSLLEAPEQLDRNTLTTAQAILQE